MLPEFPHTLYLIIFVSFLMKLDLFFVRTRCFVVGSFFQKADTKMTQLVRIIQNDHGPGRIYECLTLLS